MPEETSIKCLEVGCTISSNGICLNGFSDPTKCPHYSSKGYTEEEILGASEDEKMDEPPSYTQFYSGNVLSSKECLDITCNTLTRVIVFAGLAEAGKTTLLVTLAQLFQQNKSFAKYLFAGSRTLIGFEKLSHPSRISSDRVQAETWRTPFGSSNFLHLRARKKNLKNICTDLLFTDISGEYFNLLKNSTEECKKFYLGKRADHFALFIDADALSTNSKKHKARVDSVSILKSLIDAGTLLPNCNIQVIFSRWDLLKIKNSAADIKFVKTIQSEISEILGSNFRSRNFYEIASRPSPDSDLKLGHGIDEVFPIWVEKSGIVSMAKINLLEHSIGQAAREYLKYQVQ